jgi:hypothetical protein
MPFGAVYSHRAAAEPVKSVCAGGAGIDQCEPLCPPGMCARAEMDGCTRRGTSQTARCGPGPLPHRPPAGTSACRGHVNDPSPSSFSPWLDPRRSPHRRGGTPVPRWRSNLLGPSQPVPAWHSRVGLQLLPLLPLVMSNGADDWLYGKLLSMDTVLPANAYTAAMIGHRRRHIDRGISRVGESDPISPCRSSSSGTAWPAAGCSPDSSHVDSSGPQCQPIAVAHAGAHIAHQL